MCSCLSDVCLLFSTVTPALCPALLHYRDKLFFPLFSINVRRCSERNWVSMNMTPLPPWSNKWGPWLAQKVCPLPFCGWCGVLYCPVKKIALWWSWWWRPHWWSFSPRCWLFQTCQFHAPSLGNGSGSDFGQGDARKKSARRLWGNTFSFPKSCFWKHNS